MMEEVKRAIDNNDISKLYACGFYSDSSIHEYILKNKKRIFDDILNLKLWLDDEVAIRYYYDKDFIKASVIASNVDVARLFDNDDINDFLINNMNHIIKFLNERIYSLSDKTPKILLKNESFVNKCLDNGFLDILDYNNTKYYLENKEKIDNICIKKIEDGIIKLNKNSSKRYLSDGRFLIASIKSNNYNILLFCNNKDLDDYLLNNYKSIKNKLEGFIRSNNYFIGLKDIKSNVFLGILKNLINREIKKNKFDTSILKICSNEEFCNFISYFDEDSILLFFGKKIYQLYLYYGVQIFRMGFDKINVLNSFSIIQFEKFVKIFCFDEKIKMENVRNLYFSIVKEDFINKGLFNKDLSLEIKTLIDNNGIIDDNVQDKINYIKKLLGPSYYDYLVSLINNSLDVNKPFYELIDEVFEAYKRASVALDKNRQEKIGLIIDGICKCAYERKFDLFASTKMDFSDGYPFLVEPSDIYINRIYKEKRLKAIRQKVLDDVDLLNELCFSIYGNYQNIPFNSFVKSVKRYLKNSRFSLEDLDINVDNYLSRYCKNENIDSFYIEYFNLPLTDEYLKAYYNKKSVLDIIVNIDFEKLRFVLDNKYDELKEFLYEKQILYMLDIFNLIPSFYNKKSTISLINNFYLIESNDIYDMYMENKKYNEIPSLFNFIGDSYYFDNNSNKLKHIFKLAYNSLLKRSLPIPDITEKYNINNHEIIVSVGGFDYEDVVCPLMVNFDTKKYSELYKYVFTNENGFIIKFYDNKLIGVVFGIRYGNSIFLSNLSTIVHPSYITLSLEKFVNSIIEISKKSNDNIRHVYLSGGKFNKIFNGKILPVLTDYNGFGSVLYDDFIKINSNCLIKYLIKPRYYYEEAACKRASVIRILDLFSHNEEGTINDKDYESATIAGRSWYKDEDTFVVGPIDDTILKEINLKKC